MPLGYKSPVILVFRCAPRSLLRSPLWQWKRASLKLVSTAHSGQTSIHFTKYSPEISSTHVAQTELLQSDWLYSLFCTLYPQDYSVTANLHFLIPSLFFFFTSLHSGNHQSVLCFHGSVSILFIHLCCSLNSTPKWNQVVLVFLWLTCFTWHNTRILGSSMSYKWSDFIFYGQVIFYLYMLPVFFIHVSIDGHLL